MGCDTRWSHPHTPLSSFNPRTRTGCDSCPTIVTSDFIVSIHAPARGATDTRLRCCFVTLFQSTHPHGVRLYWQYCFPFHTKFQSTHPHGVRRHLKHSGWLFRLFQSTHPHGVRPHVGLNASARSKFQSTHPHGVRL